MMILVPRELLELLLEKVEDLDDKGPGGEGWQSEELESAIEQLKELLKKEPGAA